MYVAHGTVNSKLVIHNVLTPNLTSILAFFLGTPTTTSRLQTTDYAPPVNPETAFSTPGRRSCTPTVSAFAASLTFVTLFEC
jgi:hypothetical protein